MSSMTENVKTALDTTTTPHEEQTLPQEHRHTVGESFKEEMKLQCGLPADFHGKNLEEKVTALMPETISQFKKTLTEWSTQAEQALDHSQQALSEQEQQLNENATVEGKMAGQELKAEAAVLGAMNEAINLTRDR